MKNHSIHALVVLLAIGALAAPLVLAGDAPNIVGTWDTVASTPEGDMPGTMTLTVKDDALEAEMELAGQKRRVSDEALEGDVLKLTVFYDGYPYKVELTVDGDRMEGTYDGVQASGALSATRQK